MIKTLLALSIFGLVSLTAAPIDDMMELYNQKSYEKACNYGLRHFKKNSSNYNYIMLYAFSCLKADYIDRLAVPITALRYTPTQRQNAAYFATILLQKKMLYHALIDGTSLKGIVLPLADHPISVVFTLFAREKYRKEKGIYYLKDPKDPQKDYHVYIQQDRTPHLIVEEYINDKMIKEHRYW